LAVEGLALASFRPAQHAGQGSAQNHWVLDEAGAFVVAAELGLERAELRWRAQTALAIVSSSKLAHQLAVNEFFTRLAEDANDAGGELQRWWGERRSRDALNAIATPDGYGRLHMPGEPSVEFLLELDRGSEDHARLKEKARRYAKALPRSELRDPLVLLLLPSRERTARAADGVAASAAPICRLHLDGAKPRAGARARARRARARTPPPPPRVRSRLVNPTERGACMQNEHARPSGVPRAQPLAVWRLERTRRTDPLPLELVRAAIAHYTDPGELVLVPKLRGGELLHAAAALGRRALPLTPGAAKAEGVTPLRPQAGAALVLAPLGARPTAHRLEHVTARLLPLLRPGGFLALARGARSDSGALGDVVRACQQVGLQYWQHVVALPPDISADAASGTRAQPSRARQRRNADRLAIRCHHDLLVFRRPADAIEQATTATVAASAA
jgi:Replication-relaxation